ncbi:hypothetical protein [Tepidibacillus marianensis]|uniref:hypothetical protein n=1 Tax=Tepidibacillus marianensis TaxID=3131995 RepID=UPI0030CFA006
MINVQEMRSSVNHLVEVTLTDGMVIQGYCTEYLWPEDEEEEHNITIKQEELYTEINQSEIKSIKIIS